MLKKQDGLCTICKGIIDDCEKAEIDHIVAKVNGGTDKKNNLQLIHATCHQQKTATERRQRAIMRRRENSKK
jgi:RNA-directed DNA polymerase